MQTSRFGLLWFFDHPAIGRRILRLGPLFFCVFLVTFSVGWLLILAGAISIGDNYVKIDFFSFYASSVLAVHGHAASAYDALKLTIQEAKLPGNDAGLQPWRNPPIFFLFIWPLALLPLSAALASWLIATSWLLLSALRRISSSTTVLLLAISFPATWWNTAIGQNGFLLAGLFAWGMVLLPSRPTLAGVAFGAMAFKPQFFPLLIIALWAGGERKALRSAITTTVGLAALSLVLFGLHAWTGFVDEALRSGDSIYSGGQTLAKMQSVSALLLLIGLPIVVTQLVQGVVTSVCVLLVVLLWRREDVPLEYKAAGLSTAILLASPYSYHYDLEILGVGALFLGIKLAEEGWRAGDVEVLALAWMTPLASMITGLTMSVVLGPFTMALLLVILLRRIGDLGPFDFRGFARRVLRVRKGAEVAGESRTLANP